MKKNAGQSVFEVVLAVGVVTVVLIALVALVSQTQRNVNAAKNRSAGSRMVQEANEWLRNERDMGWTTFYARTNGNTTWCLNSLGWSSQGGCGGNMTGQPFRREVAFVRDNSNSNTVEAEVRVAWTDSQGAHEIKASTHFTNWRGQ